MKTIKILAIVAIAASALSLGACAHKEEASMSTSTGSSSTTGMSK